MREGLLTCEGERSSTSAHSSLSLSHPPLHCRNSIRIGFFDWLQKKHAQLFGGEGAEDKGKGDAQPPSGGKVAPLDSVVEDGAAAASASSASAGSASAGSHPAAEEPKQRSKRLSSRLYSCLCLKCGEDDLHWMADTSAGTVLSSAFILACALLLASKPSGCDENGC